MYFNFYDQKNIMSSLYTTGPLQDKHKLRFSLLSFQIHFNFSFFDFFSKRSKSKVKEKKKKKESNISENCQNISSKQEKHKIEIEIYLWKCRECKPINKRERENSCWLNMKKKMNFQVH